MGIYKVISYKVEDIFVKLLSKNQEPEIVKEKVSSYRTEKEKLQLQKKEEKDRRAAEQKQLQTKKREEQEKFRKEREDNERKEIESLLSKIMDNGGHGYSNYEYNEVKRNRNFFIGLAQRIFEPNEKALSFIACEFDKSSKREIRGYLIPTNKRVLFVGNNFNHLEKFRYQTIITVNWFKDGLLERGFKIQYGKRRLEFDEIFDQEQLQKVGNIILNKATARVI